MGHDDANMHLQSSHIGENSDEAELLVSMGVEGVEGYVRPARGLTEIFKYILWLLLGMSGFSILPLTEIALQAPDLMSRAPGFLTIRSLMW